MVLDTTLLSLPKEQQEDGAAQELLKSLQQAGIPHVFDPSGSHVWSSSSSDAGEKEAAAAAFGGNLVRVSVHDHAASAQVPAAHDLQGAWVHIEDAFANEEVSHN